MACRTSSKPLLMFCRRFFSDAKCVERRACTWGLSTLGKVAPDLGSRKRAGEWPPVLVLPLIWAAAVVGEAVDGTCDIVGEAIKAYCCWL